MWPDCGCVQAVLSPRLPCDLRSSYPMRTEALPGSPSACTAAGASLAIWTTTPWTIPANAAVAVNDKLQYVVAEMQVGAQSLDPRPSI